MCKSKVQRPSQILNPKLEPRLLTCKCIGFIHLFKHDHTIKCTYKSVFFVLCLFASSFELFFNCFHVRHFITWQFTCKICQKLYTNYRLKGKNMSNVNEIMMCYKAWQYHKIGINIKKKRHLAMQHIQIHSRLEVFFPNISVFTAVSSHPIFFLGHVQYEDWIKVKKVVYFSLRFFFPRDKFWCKNLSSSKWFLQIFLEWKCYYTQALVSDWNSQQLWNTVQRKHDTQLRQRMLNKCTLLLYYFLFLDQSKNELELVKHQDSKIKINTGSVSITSYELKVLKGTVTLY